MSGLTVLESTDPGWADFIAGHLRATPFHHPAWASLAADYYRFRAFAVATSDATAAPSARRSTGTPHEAMSGSTAATVIPLRTEAGVSRSAPMVTFGELRLLTNGGE